MGKRPNSRWKMSLEATVPILYVGSSGYWLSNVDPRWEHHLAVPWMTKQPSLGTEQLAPQGEGHRKSGLTEARLSSPSWLATVNGHLLKWSQNIKTRKVCTHLQEWKILKVACLNVRAMLDTAYSNRPERCSALIAHKLSRLNVDIAALSEVCFPGEGSLQEHGVGYTLFWSGEPTTEERLSGVVS